MYHLLPRWARFAFATFTLRTSAISLIVNVVSRLSRAAIVTGPLESRGADAQVPPRTIPEGSANNSWSPLSDTEARRHCVNKRLALADVSEIAGVHTGHSLHGVPVIFAIRYRPPDGVRSQTVKAS